MCIRDRIAPSVRKFVNCCVPSRSHATTIATVTVATGRIACRTSDLMARAGPRSSREDVQGRGVVLPGLATLKALLGLERDLLDEDPVALAAGKGHVGLVVGDVRSGVVAVLVEGELADDRVERIRRVRRVGPDGLTSAGEVGRRRGGLLERLHDDLGARIG